MRLITLLASKVFVIGLLILHCSFSLRAQIVLFPSNDFENADSVAALYSGYKLTNLKELTDKLTTPFEADHDKFRAIYKWVCENIENDPYFYVRNKEQRQRLKDKPEKLADWNKDFSAQVFKKLRQEHKTVCTGYAYLIKEMAHQAGINCVIVDGYGRTAQANIGGEGILNHSWNAVQLNGQWYLCDATWSSGEVMLEKSYFVKNFENAYFLAEPSFFVQNHYPLDTAWFLFDNHPDLATFLNAPLIYEKAIGHQVQVLNPSSFKLEIAKTEKLDFQFTSKSDLKGKKMKLQIMQAGYINTINTNLKTFSEGVYGFEQTFKRKGLYDIHLVMNDEYLYTFTVRVK